MKDVLRVGDIGLHSIKVFQILNSYPITFRQRKLGLVVKLLQVLRTDMIERGNFEAP